MDFEKHSAQPQNKAQHGRASLPLQESPISRPATRSSSSAKWELGWHDPDAMLKISFFDDSHAKRKKGATQGLRDKIRRMEQAMTSSSGRRRARSSSSGRRDHKHLETFRSLVRSVILLLRCFRMRRKFAVQDSNMTLTHHEKTEDLKAFQTSSVSRELRRILSTPPEYRTSDQIRKVQFYLRATGASRLLASASSSEDLANLARHIAYERYETDRMVAQQGRAPDRFYFMITGKLLIVKEYHIDTGIISKTVGVLTKGMTTDVEEMEQRTLRKASLICRGPVETLVLDRDDYFLIHGERGGAPREFLSRHYLFRSFPFNTLEAHSLMIRLQYFPKGAVIFGGGEEFEWIYAIKSGECTLVRLQMVADIKRQKWALFNKHTVQELGFQKTKRVQSAAEMAAEFRMWRGPSRPALFSAQAPQRRNCYTAPVQRVTAKPLEPPPPPPRVAESRVGFGIRRDLGMSPPPSAKGSSRLDYHEVIAEENGYEGATTQPIEKEPQRLPKIRISNMPSADSLEEADETEEEKDQVTSAENTERPMMPLLSRTKLSASTVRVSTTRESRFEESTFKRKMTPAKSTPSMRRAYLELGKLRSGDVLVRYIADRGVVVPCSHHYTILFHIQDSTHDVVDRARLR